MDGDLSIGHLWTRETEIPYPGAGSPATRARCRLPGCRARCQLPAAGPAIFRKIFLEKVREKSRKSPGKVREKSGKSPGKVQEKSGKSPGKVREKSGESPGK